MFHREGEGKEEKEKEGGELRRGGHADRASVCRRPLTSLPMTTQCRVAVRRGFSDWRPIHHARPFSELARGWDIELWCNFAAPRTVSSRGRPVRYPESDKFAVALHRGSSIRSMSTDTTL